ncbi:hypothetical protein Agabi119p4_1657 [Agaricus bisporus var. burnettii]|uniref:Transmembrane protein n=1 Tax=Agaricus bisporus var. burnettii TaxID=192524 RepID=A0A8H7KJC1_AGABI|nr:hypothetical protein Agabi119p4_1657 [Agaricus bisporus var. burnettii]
MALQSIIVEDCSPLIQYAPEDAWRDAPFNDTMATLYSGGSYHLSSTKGATATFKFRGVGFTIFGGRRPGYGSFSLSLDGRQLYDGNPVPESSPVNNTLAVASGLPDDDHTLVLTNSGGTLVDIDAIIFETQIGSAGEKSIITTIDDTDPKITYLPAAAWDVNTRLEFQNSTLHYSQAADASASVQFSGNAIALYGTASPDHADISVIIDDKTVIMPPGTSSRVNAVRTPVLLFWADGLPNGQHTMVVSKRPSGNNRRFIDVDSFVVYSSISGARNSFEPSLEPSPHSSGIPGIKPSRTTVIAVSAVAGAIALFVTYIVCFLDLQTATPTPDNPAFVFPSPTFLAPVRRSDFDQKRVSKLSVAPSYYDGPESPGSGKSFEGRGMASVASSQWSILTAPPVVPQTTQNTLSLQRPQRPPRPPVLDIGSLQ